MKQNNIDKSMNVIESEYDQFCSHCPDYNNDFCLDLKTQLVEGSICPFWNINVIKNKLGETN